MINQQSMEVLQKHVATNASMFVYMKRDVAKIKKLE